MSPTKTLIIALLILFTTTAIARADDCSDPSGQTGEIIFNDAHKVMQYCNGTRWRAMIKAPPSLTDGDKGGVIVSNNGQTWTIKRRSCPTGWSLSAASTYCYSPLQSAVESYQAQQICSTYPYAHTCSIGEYYMIESTGAQRWSTQFCSGTQALMLQVGSGWNCVNYTNKYQFRCCMPNPANFQY